MYAFCGWLAQAAIEKAGELCDTDKKILFARMSNREVGRAPVAGQEQWTGEARKNPLAGLFDHVSGFYKGVAIGLVVIALFFAGYSRFMQREFAPRFLDALTANQEAVVRLSRGQFAPEYEQLMLGYHALRAGGSPNQVFAQFDKVESLSLDLQAEAKSARERFPYADFSPDENRRIKAYFEVSAAMDRGRHEYLTKLSDCLRLTYLDTADASDFCNQISADWNTQAEKLLKDLIAALELTPQEASRFQGIAP